MRITIRLLISLLSALPAFLFAACALTQFQDEYFSSTYTIVALIFIGGSLFLGLILPTRMHGGKFDFPWLWLFIAGGLAWLVALVSLALLNLTPLCVGQNNGDGINDHTLCVLYTILITLVYSPVELVLLTLNAIIGGKILSALIRLNRYKTTKNPE